MADPEIISYVLASRIRFGILQSLGQGMKTPSELKQEYHVPISRISESLSNLRKKGLVKNLTPQRRKAILYSLTLSGQRLLKALKKREMGKNDQ